jgi:hypothetical protein
LEEYVNEHDDDQEPEVHDEAAEETESFPDTLEDVEDATDEENQLDVDPDDSEL